ncbi:PREDICTED: cyclin-D4-1-like [Lupinus angustifolius]|uniref:cyclin-D4-1-like n=1 Tax=Lupinus angustifolius TaxID=3871 RepID=UPI00092E4E73|nr:PREDICTED: cyclin-D4-1-like [Lupinus angustifolius]
MEEGTPLTLSLKFFEHKKIFFGDFESDSELDHNFQVSDESVEVMVQREGEHLPREDYLKNLRSGESNMSVVRKQALDWILKAHTYFGFGAWSFFLCVNYFDRFLSISKLPRGINWFTQLLATACFQIAAKMGETKVPQYARLHVGSPKFIFEALTIQRMELLVLNTLEWKMQAITPCSFIGYFISKITCEKHQMKSSLSKSMKLMLSISTCIDFLEFRASEIAAAVAISVTRELEAKEIHKALSSLAMVKKERVLKCLELMKDMSVVKVSGNLFTNESVF